MNPSNLPTQEWPAEPKVQFGPWACEAPLDDESEAFRQSLRQFATKVMRPIGQDLDRLSAEQVAAKGSRLYEFFSEYDKLGISLELLFSLSDEQRAVMFPILFEELGWGDAGLAIAAAARMLPFYMAAKMGNQFVLKEYSEQLIGCWGITEPDHGTDSLDVSQQLFNSQGRYGRPNCTARVSDGHIVINGQKAAWVSNGSIADLCVLYCAAETANGPDPQHGFCVVVPTHLPGVSRGKPLEKLGQRALPQGELYFDNVKVSLDHLLAGPDEFKRAVYAIHTDANLLMGATFSGVARSAYDHALAYAHERKQGGLPIIRHQDVARRLFHMLRKVESAQALTRRVSRFNAFEPVPALQAAMLAKVNATELAFEVASDAIQMFGGNGLTCEYPVEKIFRDARASMIEDGCNQMLAIKGGYNLINPEWL
ncbi:acyl-CoA dehydrogenase family protein [Pseudomonas sp. H9]|uniref:acyl-CoA dehydrogenase family protein n=1 Tax=Pseudomonas sp. H9 TaxID=483968 RepID=UPI001057A9CF|nr:acyl-CoA dehydrogenase [Pseudomonas sp. H9]TDF83846.1 acyl-CoA dehydrogenase [Pseudomonas sp. H9]